MPDEITITLTEAEFQSLANLLDVAVRAGGLRTAKEALQLTARMEAAYENARGGISVTSPRGGGIAD
jgi:hypothetical protein